MLRALLRLTLALGGAAAAAFLVAALEVRAVSAGVADAGEESARLSGLFAAELGLLAPLAVGVGGAVGVLVLLLQPRAESPLGWLLSLREGAVLDRLRASAALPVAIVAAFVWCLACAHVGRASMSAGAPAEAGLTAGLGAVGALVVVGASALAVLPLVRRLLAVGSESVPQLLDPLLTGGAALVVVGALFALGVSLGDTSGAGGGALGVFGVLKRAELDSSPLANAGVLALGAYALTVALARRSASDPRALGAAGVGLLLQAALLVLCVRASSSLGATPDVARGLEKHAPAGRLALAGLRRLTDCDRDGFSARFAGGDCDDRDARVNPNAVDVPGNGVDEDCSGDDTPAAAPPEPRAAKEAEASRPERSFNVILLTVDTLRPDLGFMGYGKPTSPNLDKLAERSTVFERAYSMASYTGKAVGPMLIGKYPSETRTNFSHFNKYFESNVMLAERARDAGYHTLAGMCHWYFKPSSGLSQGFDVWDSSAIPPGMSDNDTSVSSERMADLALKLLRDPFGTARKGAADAGAASPGAGGDAGAAGAAGVAAGADAGVAGEAPARFFAWFHFFDPHAQYVAHGGAPDFTGEKGSRASRAVYDQEVWFTDKHIGRVLDYVASQPWAEETAIVMTADHGEAFYEHGMLFHGSEIWNELVHVPLFVYVPGAAPRRVPVNRSHIDLAPTMIELMGLPVDDDGLRGKSLLADVYLPSGAAHEERDVYIDMPAGPFNQLRRAVIAGPTPGMKLIHFGGASYQLFDLEADPEEKKDLAKDKDKLREVRARMNAIRGRLQEIEVKPK